MRNFSRITQVIHKDGRALAHGGYGIFLYLSIGWQNTLCKTLDHSAWEGKILCELRRASISEGKNR